MEIRNYKGYDLHVMDIVINPNGRATQTVLIYKNGQPVGGAYADTEISNALDQATKKVDGYLKKEKNIKQYVLFWSSTVSLDNMPKTLIVNENDGILSDDGGFDDDLLNEINALPIGGIYFEKANDIVGFSVTRVK